MTPACAEEPLPRTSSIPTTTIPAITYPKNLVITSEKLGTMVTISMEDGSITYGPNYKPDEAAKIFWDALGFEARARAKEAGNGR